MAKKRASPKSPSRGGSRRGSGGAGGTVLALALGAGAAAGAGYLYLHTAPGHAPLRAPAPAVASAPVTGMAPAKTDRPGRASTAVRSAPFGTSEDVFEAGARQYARQCASCHGTPVREAVTKPAAQQFWREGKRAVAGKAPGEIYAAIADGAPASGMPGYAHTLTETQIWQLALLLKSADGELPDPVLGLLRAPEKR